MNSYAEHDVHCYECENCEPYNSGSMATCDTALDAVFENTGIRAAEVRFDSNQDAGRCHDFDPTQECLDRIAEERLPMQVRNGVVPGVDFPATLRRCG